MTDLTEKLKEVAQQLEAEIISHLDSATEVAKSRQGMELSGDVQEAINNLRRHCGFLGSNRKASSKTLKHGERVPSEEKKKFLRELFEKDGEMGLTHKMICVALSDLNHGRKVQPSFYIRELKALEDDEKLVKSTDLNEGGKYSRLLFTRAEKPANEE